MKKNRPVQSLGISGLKTIDVTNGLASGLYHQMLPVFLIIGGRMRNLLLFLFTLSVTTGFAQEKDSLDQKFVTDREAKTAVYKIARYSGLYPDFIVISDNSIPSAIAYVKNKKRYIKYNPTFIKRIVDSTHTDWAAISVMAHEIGHHLLGHTIKMVGSNPGDELAADRYSGFILFKMGATLEDSKKAMLVAGHDHGTKTHPPKHARLLAIEQGWMEAKALDEPEPNITLEDHSDRNFVYQINFTGDNNDYFVTDSNRVVWFDNFATPIVLGTLEVPENSNYAFVYRYNKEMYFIDGAGQIWNQTLHGSLFIVGELKELER